MFASQSAVTQQSVAAMGSSTAILARGADVRTYVAAVNVIARHRWHRFEPYAGIGLALVTAEVSTATFSVKDFSPGLNVLAGLKGFVTDHIALFVEGKYTYASFQFEDAGLSGAGIKEFMRRRPLSADYRGISDRAAESENFLPRITQRILGVIQHWPCTLCDDG